MGLFKRKLTIQKRAEQKKFEQRAENQNFDDYVHEEYENRNPFFDIMGFLCLLFAGILLLSYFSMNMEDLNSNNEIKNLLGIFGAYISSYSFLGDGLGRYDYLAREFGKWAIVDNEFQNHIAELGYFGASLLILMLLFTTFRCYKNKWLFVENSVVFFFVSAMIGASVLSNPHQFNYIFWYTLGLLWSDKYIICKRRKV